MRTKPTFWQRKRAEIIAIKRIFNAVLPAVLLALAAGQIYAFTLFSTPIAEHLGCAQSQVQFAFSLGIFFLGAGAASFGTIVERNIRLSTFIGTALFIEGMATTAAGVQLKSIALVYLGYGCLVGLGTGIIYISPVKTLMMWFARHKAVAASISIVSFGLGSSLCALIFSVLKPVLSISGILYALAIIYAAPMAAGALLLRKPRVVAKTAVASAHARFSYLALLKDSWFVRTWLFMFLNISCGLALIPLSQQLMSSAGYGPGLVTAVISVCGVMNGGGRLVFAWWSDRLAVRINILLVILAVSVAAAGASLLPALVGLALLAVNACYGAGFSTIPAVLADHYGMDNISKIHGAVLSAWGVAGLAGNLAALKIFELGGIRALSVVLMLLYAANFANVLTLKRKVRK